MGTSDKETHETSQILRPHTSSHSRASSRGEEQAETDNAAEAWAVLWASCKEGMPYTKESSSKTSTLEAVRNDSNSNAGRTRRHDLRLKDPGRKSAALDGSGHK